LAYYQVTEDVSLVHQMLNGLYRLGIQSLMVEGGTGLLQSFIDEGIWDEARVICNEGLVLGSGLPAPVFTSAALSQTVTILSDTIRTWHRISR
jgi:diaminohydroxyphosphoribosylaminopyrimidine deaminase/5-amino-6-(5-phosphoribosylamino)uracil reductase